MSKKRKKNKLTTVSKLKKDERIKVLLGFFIISFSIYLLLSFISYFFTWQIDQSKLDISFIELFKDSSIIVENWSGKLGAMLAHRFMYDWFGLASYSVIFILLLIGIRLLNFKLLSIKTSLKYSIILTIWTSVFLGFVFHNSTFLPGGSHGYFLSEWLNSFIGHIGTSIVLAISLFSILTYAFESFIIKIKTSIKSLFDFKIKDTKLNNNTAETTATNIDTEQTQVEEPESEKVEEKNDDTFSIENTLENEEDTVEIENTLTTDENNDTTQDLNNNIETIEIKIEDTDILNNENSLVTEEHKEPDTKQSDDKKEPDLEVLNTENDDISTKINKEPQGDYDPTLDLSNYKLPPIELLEEHDSKNSGVTEEELLSNKNRIVETLGHYKIKIDKIKAVVGPTITLYEIIPAPGVRISKIKNLEDDIALSLAALGIRIIAPIPGRGTVGIEVPNANPQIVSMRSIISSKKFQESKFELPIALGKTISNETFVVDLAKMPHMLVAGATGQGKSVGLNAILASLLYKKHPSQLKLVLVDPKKVELTLYQTLEKYFLASLPDADETIITDTMKVVNTLNSLCVEMDDRYDLLKLAKVRNIKEYNAKFISRKLNPENGHRFLPYIVVVIDEFADLIMTAGKEVELPIARLAQLARAIGIHLIIATQRPTTNIITGLIKANFPARIAFKVTSMMDSRTILDSTGANQLIGRGDMLVSQGSDVTRLQCAFIDTPELENIMSFIEKQQSYPTPYYLPEAPDDNNTEAPNVDLTKRDAMFEDAARIIVANQQGSTSLIQRKFSIGYNRAGRIIDQLEAAGIVGPFEGSKARQVLIPDEYSLEQLLNNLNN
jgi:S-DNA-T family DNA segregation ATPase FtsK/SpoIIIE